MKISELRRRFEKVSRNLNLPRPEVIKVRFQVKPKASIELYFNEETQTLTSALLVKDKRIFGINGYPKSGVWHIHPLDKVDEHREVMPMKVEKILEEYAQVLKKLTINYE